MPNEARRIGQPDDIARVAVFLASDDSGWLRRAARGIGGLSIIAPEPAAVQALE